MLISPGDLITKSFALYKDNLGLFIKYVLISYIPGAIMAVAAIIFGGAAGVLFYSEKTGMAVTLVVILAALVLIAIIASVWIFLAFIRVIASRYLGKTPDKVGVELRKAVPLILPYIGATILFGLIMLGGAILFIVPAVIFGVWFAFYFYEIALDNKGVVDSLKGSKELVRDRWWGILLRLFAPAAVFGIIAFIAQGIVQFPLEIVAQSAESAGVFITATIVSALLSAAINVLITPLTAAAQAILYIEAKNTPVPAATTPSAPAEPPKA